MSPGLGLLVLALVASGTGPSPAGGARAPGLGGSDLGGTARIVIQPARIQSTLAEPGSLAQADDPWVGEDKLQHLGMSFAATSFGYGAARLALDREPATFAAAGAALAAGVAKEILDHRAGRRFSARDLLWDAAGVAAALTLIDRTR